MMIPYIPIPPLKIPLPFGIKPLELHAFGALVLIGILIGSRITQKRARERGIDAEVMHSAIFWLLIAGFVGAHLVHVIFYYPEMIKEDPLSIFMIWAGISSFGGFCGAFIGLYLFTRRNGEPFGKFADVVALGLLPGWVFGRLGCTITFDHPGKYTDFFLAFRVPDPAHPGQMIGQHNLGFYEVPFTLALIPLLEWVRKRWNLPDGHIALLIGVLYAPYRFFLDFLRIRDATYLGLTPAQIACILLFIAGVAILLWPRFASRQSVASSGKSAS